MHVRTMQLVDRWIGIPLCFILSLFQLVIFWRKSKPRVSPRKVLFIELSEMGSAIISYSAIEMLRKTLPQTERYFLVFEKNREAVELLGIIDTDKIITISDKSILTFIVTTARTLRRLREIGIDSVIDLELFSRFTAIVSYLSGAKERIGFSNYTSEGLYRGSLLTCPVYYNPHRHMVLNFLALSWASINVVEQPAVKVRLDSYITDLPRYQTSAASRAYIHRELEQLLGNNYEKYSLVVINPDPGVMLPIRGWSITSYVEVIDRLTAYSSGVRVILIGLPSSEIYAKQILASVKTEQCMSLMGKTRTLDELLALLEKSDVLLTTDGGPAHFAALTPVASVVLFGPETPSLYGVLSSRSVSLYSDLACSPCLNAANHRHSPCKNSLCLKSISVEQVVQSVRCFIDLPHAEVSDL